MDVVTSSGKKERGVPAGDQDSPGLVAARSPTDAGGSSHPARRDLDPEPAASCADASRRSREEAERNLLTATGRGDHLAFELLVNRYRAPVCGFIHRILRDRQQAEDVAQEVFMNVYRAAPAWQATGRVSAWVFRIAWNLSMNEIKRRGRWSRIRDLLHLRNLEEPATAPEDPVEQMEFRADLATALAELPENQRAALLLRITEGLSYVEIASVLSVSVSAVESLVWRARTRLRERLGAHRE